MRHTIRSAATALVAAAVLAITGATAAAAASPPPGTPLALTASATWAYLGYHPGAIYVGNGGSPFVAYLSWSAPGTWTGTSAANRAGSIVQYWPNGGPSYQWPSTARPVKVYLHDVQSHNGQPYFAKMRWSWTNSHGKARVLYWKVGTSGSRYAFWQART
jgi:hypothetical protein